MLRNACYCDSYINFKYMLQFLSDCRHILDFKYNVLCVCFFVRFLKCVPHLAAISNASPCIGLQLQGFACSSFRLICQVCTTLGNYLYSTITYLTLNIRFCLFVLLFVILSKYLPRQSQLAALA
jgi:hypothetical protein